MKTIKSYLLALVALVSLGVFATSCQDDVDAPASVAPVATLQANTSIAELKTAYWNDAVNYIDTIGVREDGSHYIIKGRVISSDESGNIFKSLIIADETAALPISINSYNLYLKYRVGQEIVIDATGMYIGKYNGLQQLGFPEWYAAGNAWEATFMSTEFFEEHIELNGWPEPAKVDTLVVNSFDELATNPEGLVKWQGQLVRFNNVTFQDGGKETFSLYHENVNRNLIDSKGASLIVRTSGYSNFWNQTLPEGAGDVVAILSYYGTAGWQLMLNDVEGCMNFGHPTVAPGSESNPFTVDDAIAFEAQGKAQKGWVKGYIVGAVAEEVTTVTSNDDIEWTAPTALANTLVIASSPDVKDYTKCLIVPLASGSKFQEYGNLRSNPANLGKEINVKGTFSKYMDTYGVVDNAGTPSEFSIEGVEVPGASTGGDGDGTKEKPYTVAQIQGMNPQSTSEAVESGVWVEGYIVGWADMSSTFYINAETQRFTVPATMATNILVAATPNATSYTECIGIQLPSGAVRKALNLQDNPGNLGKKVLLKGDVMKYSGVPGLKNTSEYVLDNSGEPSTPDTPTVGDGGTKDNPFTVAQVQAFDPQSTSEAVKTGVWVKGYIVGWADMSSTYYINAETQRFTVPATLATNILVAATPTATSYTECIGVQLPSGDVRKALNLVDNPGNLGKEVMIKGDIAKYSGVAGLRNCSEYVLDGQGSSTTPDTPSTPGAAVTSLNETFEGGAVPTGWTQVQVAGNKAWYVTSYNNNGYIAETGYKGTAPFDQWLLTPAVDLSKVTDKTLSFDTQVNGYGSTTTVFEVYVLTSADPATATKTKLNATLPTAPASGYSSWVNSGVLDLSNFSGTVYIGFRYYATADANYATWCVDNVKLPASTTGGGETPSTPDTPENPSTPGTSGSQQADFNTFNGGAANSSAYGTYKTAGGWVADWSLILAGGTDATAFVSADSSFLFPCIDGTPARPGKLTSPVFSGGLGTLSFSYGFPYNESKVGFTVNIIQDGKVVTSDKVLVDPATKAQVYEYSHAFNISGDYQVQIVNLLVTNFTTGNNKDRVAIWNVVCGEKK